MSDDRLYQGIYYDNLRITYSSSTFTITGADGNPLNSGNPSVIIMPSKATPGSFTKYLVTADQSFIDDGGASQITGALFGFTTSVAITVDVPFFIYAVANDAEDTISFMISRVQHMRTSPASANIGTTASPTSASTQNSFFALGGITTTSYDSNPCICIGSFRMRMSSSNDWTVQALSNSDGIDQFQVGTEFDMPQGQFGANSGTWTIPNGGTAPVFSTNSGSVYKFIAARSSTINHVFSMFGDGGTDGSGAVNARVSSPFINSGNWDTRAAGVLRIAAAAGVGDVQGQILPVSAANAIEFRTAAAAGTTVLWSAFGNGNRALIGSYVMNIL